MFLRGWDMKSNYRQLGQYIRQVDLRNKDGKDENLLGVSVQKTFIPSIANTVGTDFKKYKIVKKGQFTYIPDTSRRGDKIGIALLKDYEEGLVSNVYTVFEIIDKKKLIPEYLMLWFSRSEFDRYARFKSHGSVREVFDWDEMCKVQLPVPTYKKQKKIVDSYNVISERINLIRKVNDNLEAQLSTEFHRIFDNDKTNECTIGDYGEIISGATPSTANDEFFCDKGLVWLTPKDLTSTGLKFITKGEVDITTEAYNSCSTKMLPIGTVLLTSRAPVGTVAIADKELCTNQGFKSIIPNSNFGSEFVYQFLKENKALLDSHASGTTFMEISGNVLKSVPAFAPKQENIAKYKKFCSPIYNQQRSNEKEILLLKNMLKILLCQLSSR